MKEYLMQLWLSLLLVVLSGDVLYLYYAGGWVEPTQVILVTEITLLYVFIISGILNAIRIFRKLV